MMPEAQGVAPLDGLLGGTRASLPHEAGLDVDDAMATVDPAVGDMSPPEPKVIGEPIVVTGTSEMLCQHVPAATYEPVEDTPIRGGLNSTMHRTASGDVTWIEIDLEIGDEPA